MPDVPDGNNDDGDAGNGHGWGYTYLEDESEDEMLELDERDEDGLFMYQRLSETYERELADMGV